MKKYANKIELFKIGLTTYEKTLVDLRSFLRGKEYFHEEFIRKMNLVDGEIVKNKSSKYKTFITGIETKLLLLHRQVKGKN